MAASEGRNWVMVLAELRRFPQVGYKSDIVILYGLDEGDRKAIDHRYKNIELACMIDKEDQRFVLKGTSFNPLEIINVLTIQRGYKMEYNPQQHGIPLKQGNLDDKFAMVYHLSKVKSAMKKHQTPSQSMASLTGAGTEPPPPPRGDSLPPEEAAARQLGKTGIK